MADKILSELARGAWSAVTAYTIGDIVTNDGSSYICIADSTNNEPPNASYWALLASKGDQGNQGIQGNPGANGMNGVDGADVYLYIAYASDLSGANFSNTFDPLLDCIAIKKSLTPIGSPQSSDFTGLWKNYKGTIGADGQKGDQGDPGTNGVDGVNNGLKYLFNTDTADSDPGSGQIKLNNADPSLANQIFIDNLDNASADVSAFIDTWDDSTTTTLKGTIVLRQIGSEGNFAIYSVTGSVTDGTGYRKIAVTYVSSGGSFSGGAALSVSFNRTGNKGADGAGTGDVVGPASAVDSNFASFDGAGGKTIKDSGSKASDFAIASKGVTNGDTHDHSGGDGGQIDHVNLASIGTKSHALLDLLFNPPRGYLINGKIVVSVASNNITVAIKGLDGNDPSASNVVYVRIGDTIRTITSALSITRNAGTNWFNSGASILATKEVDYFVYLGYNATDGVVIGFARFPYATEYDDFSTTSTNEKYCAISTITNAAAGDDYELIGRFAATLSATASFNWSVPTYTNKNLINYPIFTTRPLDFVPTFSMTNPPSSTTIVAKYILSMHKVYIRFKITGTANAGNAGLAQTITIPFANGVQTLYTAVLANTVWTDTSTFTDIGSGGYWNDTSTINVAQTNATRKPTIISINAVYDI